MAKFQNKYRIESTRAQWWDYGWNGAYFITICTKNRQNFFGEIVEGRMNLSRTGEIVNALWYEIPNHALHVELGDFVVMPNHIHGILILSKPEKRNIAPTNFLSGPPHAETGHALSLRGARTSNDSDENSIDNQTIGQKRFQNIGKNTVSSILGSYKSAVTKHANRLGLPNGWQRLFHDHIIRNSEQYERISKYIINNPSNWKNDRFFGNDENK